MNVINDWIVNIMTAAQGYGPFLACFLILIESIFPMLPLCIFITINFMFLGPLFGFFVSWIFTILGCMVSFYIFRFGLSNKFNYLLKKDKIYIEHFMMRVEQLSFGKLVIILSIPFLPVFLINIVAGLSNISSKKYFWSLCLGKVSLVYFWGFIGTSLIDSLTSPKILIKIVLMIFIVYIVSKVTESRLKLK